MSAMPTSLELLTLHQKSFIRGSMGVSLHVMPSDHGIRIAVYVASLCLPLHNGSSVEGFTQAFNRIGNAEGDEDDPVDADETVD